MIQEKVFFQSLDFQDLSIIWSEVRNQNLSVCFQRLLRIVWGWFGLNQRQIQMKTHYLKVESSLQN
jgi:hypothetical protein